PKQWSSLIREYELKLHRPTPRFTGRYPELLHGRVVQNAVVKIQRETGAAGLEEPVRMVEEVEHRIPELQIPAFAKGKRFEQRNIMVHGRRFFDVWRLVLAV